MTPFDTPSPGSVAALVRAQPLGLVITTGTGGHDFTPLPLLATTDADDAVIELEGHFARRNPQVAAIEADPRALIVFQGPHRYLPPSAVDDRAWAPTWNYAVAQFEVEIDFLPDQGAAAIDRLMEHLGPDDWRPATHIPDRYEAMVSHVIAFRARVLGVRAKFKLGQDERGRNFADLLDWLGDDPLAGFMRDARNK